MHRAGMPSDQCQPTIALHGDLAQVVGTETVKAKVMSLLLQSVPTPLLVRPDGANRDDPRLRYNFLGQRFGGGAKSASYCW